MLAGAKSIIDAISTLEDLGGDDNILTADIKLLESSTHLPLGFSFAIDLCSVVKVDAHSKTLLDSVSGEVIG